MNSLSYKRILLIKPSSLGDIIHALPVLCGLRNRYPDARIDWLVSSSFAGLLQGHPDISNVVEFDRKRYSGVGVSPRATKDFYLFVRQLRGSRYDCAIDLQGLFRSGFLAWSTGASVRLGFAQAREGARLFYNRRVRVNKNDHAVDRNMQLLKSLTGHDEEVSFPLSLNATDADTAAAILSEFNVDINQSFVAVVPGARWETKIWPSKHFAQTIDTLATKFGVPVVLLGGPEDVSRCQAIADNRQQKPAHLAGRTSIRQFAIMIEKAALVICHDSAAMHIAVAYHRPLVAMLGPTNPARTGPYQRPKSVVRLDLDCSPCYLRNLSQCKHHHRCMEELSVDRVVSAATNAMQNHDSRTTAQT